MKQLKMLLLASALFFTACYFLKEDTAITKTLYVSPRFASTLQAQKAFIKQKPVLLWDLHGVVLKKERSYYATRCLWGMENPATFLFEAAKAVVNPTIYPKLYYQYKQNNKIIQSYFDAVKGYKTLYAELIRFSNDTYKPYKPTRAILEYAQEEGCKQYIFSNAGPKALRILQQQYPHYFSYFDSLQNTINMITPPADQWIWKPQTKAYEKTLLKIEYYNNPQFTIFIDDREENIKKAHEMGMNGIVFVSAEQVEEDLKLLLTNE